MFSLAAGCDSLDIANPFPRASDPLEVANRLTSEDLTLDEKNALVADVHMMYENDPSARNLLAVAVTYAIPGHDLSSTTLGLEFLGNVELALLDRRSATLAQWLGNELAYRAQLQKENTSLSDELGQTKAALARAQEKIDILMRIEKTIGSTSRQPDGKDTQ